MLWLGKWLIGWVAVPYLRGRRVNASRQKFETPPQRKATNMCFRYLAGCYSLKEISTLGACAMMKNRLVKFGLAGTVLTGLCCFTPILPVVLAGLGLSGLIGVLYTDAVLLPLLVGFLTLTGYAIWRQKKQR